MLVDMQKVLITTDFHDSKPALEGLQRLLDVKQYDMVLMLGDLINPRERELPYVKDFISIIQERGLPLFGLHGNNEPRGAWEYYRQTGINVHLENRKWEGYNICGIGGFGYLNEEGFEDLSIHNLIINQQTLFLTHVPPREIKEQKNGPLVHLFGHRHVLAYTKQVGGTLLVQCPAGIRNKITELELPTLKVSFLDL